MKLTLIRKWFGSDKTIDKLLVNGHLKYYALEDLVRKQDVKVAGETAIPYGTYKVIVSHSAKLGRRLPLINDVPMFSGIRIHAGIDESWTEGCVLISDKVQDGNLVLNYQAEKDLVSLIDEAINRGEEVTITITNAQRRYAFISAIIIACAIIGFIIIKIFTPQK